MKVIKTASGRTLKISKKEWEKLGKDAGWIKKEASASRIKVIEDMRKLLGDNFFIKTTEEFNGTKGGIWFSNEDEGINGMPLYDSYGETEMLETFGETGYAYGFHPELQAIMDKNGWHIEPYDSGTLMAFED